MRENIRVQESRVNQIRFDFENLVLNAQREVEDAIIEFIKSSEQLEFDLRNANANRDAVFYPGNGCPVLPSAHGAQGFVEVVAIATIEAQELISR